MTLIWAFLGTRSGQYLLIGLVATAAVGMTALLIYRHGEAAAAAAAASLALERTAAAARARAKVKPHDQGAMDADPFNRDRR